MLPLGMKHQYYKHHQKSGKQVLGMVIFISLYYYGCIYTDESSDEHIAVLLDIIVCVV